MKKEIRVLGIDDSPFKKEDKGDLLVIGTVYRGGDWLDGVMSTKIKIDGNNSTSKLTDMINKSKFKSQLRCVILDGIALGGFNIVDIHELWKKTKIPVMVVIRRMPDFKSIKDALRNMNKENKYEIIEKAGEVFKVGKIYIQLSGIGLKEAREILDITCTRSLLPEPIRTAHMIAAGVVKGESKGNA